MSAFITFEGIEGCGKTTQARLLAEHLRSAGREAVLTREPGGTELTEQIRALLADPESRLDRHAELLLFLADRAQHVASVIRPGLARGAVVISDRYSDSTMAYQGHGRGHDLDWLRTLNAWACLDTVPDLTLWIDCDIETGVRRATKETGGPGDRFESEPIEFHRRVRAGFVEQHAEAPDRIVRLDGDATIQVIAADVIRVVEAHLAAGGGIASGDNV
jgi:dTMP kinase